MVLPPLYSCRDWDILSVVENVGILYRDSVFNVHLDTLKYVYFQSTVLLHIISTKRKQRESQNKSEDNIKNIC